MDDLIEANIIISAGDTEDAGARLPPIVPPLARLSLSHLAAGTLRLEPVVRVCRAPARETRVCRR